MKLRSVFLLFSLLAANAVFAQNVAQAISDIDDGLQSGKTAAELKAELTFDDYRTG